MNLFSFDKMMGSFHFLAICFLGLVGVIACSPTKFDRATNPLDVCDSTTQVCQAGEDGSTLIVQNFRVGAGKVDILFVIDSSASMSVVQTELSSKFNGFISALDSREIDYRVGVTTTDLLSSQSNPLVRIAGGGPSDIFISRETPDRINRFRNTIRRQETLDCENFIRVMYNTHGPSFQVNPDYVNNYDRNCPSGDTRGIGTAINVLRNSGDSFIRKDSNLSVILISNDEVRGGRLPLDASLDTAEAFMDVVAGLKGANSSWSNKYVEFNSIVTTSAACGLTQSNNLKDGSGRTIVDTSGNPVIRANPGLEYIKLSQMNSQDVDGNTKPFGIVKSICESDFTGTFSRISGNISESSRLMGLRCNAVSAPKVTIRGTNQTVPFLWKGDRILFQRGSEGLDIDVEYKCNVGQVR